MSKVFFIYNPRSKKWEQTSYLNTKHIVVCVGNLVFCPIHKQFEEIIHYSQLTKNSNFTATKTCLIETDCYVLLDKVITYKEKMKNIHTLEELLLRNDDASIYAYEIIQDEKLYLKTYSIRYRIKNGKLVTELFEHKQKVYRDNYHEADSEKVHYLSKRLKLDKRNEKLKDGPYKSHSIFLHNHLTREYQFYPKKKNLNNIRLNINICDEITDYLILRERVNSNHKYDFGSTSIHKIDRYIIWQNYADINFSLIRNNLNLVNNYDFKEMNNYETFSTITNEFKIEKNGYFYNIYKKNPLTFLKMIVLCKIGFTQFEATWIIEKLKNKNFLGEYELSLKFSPLEQFGMKFSKDNFFPEFLHWLNNNSYKEFSKNICIAQSNECRYDYKGRYILWKILEITNNLPMLEEGLSVQKFISRAYIGFDAIAHIFALDFTLDKQYKDGKLGEYSYTELLTFQDILKISKIVGIKPSYRGFLSCILNKDRYIMIRKEDKVVGLLLASIGGFKLKSIEEITENSLEGWKLANNYYENEDEYIRIPEIYYERGRFSKQEKLDDLYIK